MAVREKSARPTGLTLFAWHYSVKNFCLCRESLSPFAAVQPRQGVPQRSLYATSFTGRRFTGPNLFSG